MTDYDLPLSSYNLGDRVELHPGTDTWMSGDRYGNVVKVGQKMVCIKMDLSGRVLGFAPCWVGKVYL